MNHTRSKTLSLLMNQKLMKWICCRHFPFSFPVCSLRPLPMVMIPLPWSSLHYQNLLMQYRSLLLRGAGGNRPVMPEGISQEEMETPLSEAVHKGFRNVRNSPHNDPVGKVLNAQFTLNFRQLASLSLDRQFQEICGRLLRMGTSEEELQASAAQAAAASQVMQVACHSFSSPAPEGAVPIASCSCCISAPSNAPALNITQLP